MKLHNPFHIADEPNTFLLKISLCSILAATLIGLIALLLIKPVIFASVFGVLVMLRVIYAIFKGK